MMVKSSANNWLVSRSLAATLREEPPLSEMLGVVVLKLSRNELTCHATFFLCWSFRRRGGFGLKKWA